MMKKIGILLFLRTVVTTSVIAACDVVETCVAPTLEPGDKITNPYDCQSYYMCGLDNKPPLGPFDCEESEYFGVDELSVPNCVPYEEGDEQPCPNVCDLQPKSCAAIVTDCDDVSGSDACSFADAADCSKYFLCSVQGVAIQISCEAPNLYYDGTNCVDDSSECCINDLCTPYCDAGDLNLPVADPCDCHSYFLCTEEYRVPTLRLTCDGDNVFVPREDDDVVGPYQYCKEEEEEGELCFNINYPCCSE